MAQTITVTRDTPIPAPVTLAADSLCVHLSGTFGVGGVVLDASDDGTAWAPIAVARDLGPEAFRSAGCFGVALRTGWRLRARAAKPEQEDGTFAVRVAVE